MIFIFVVASLLTAWILVRIVSRIGSPFPLDNRPAGSWFVGRTATAERLSGPEEQWRESIAAAANSRSKWAELGDHLARLEAAIVESSPQSEPVEASEPRFSRRDLEARIDAMEQQLARNDDR